MLKNNPIFNILFMAQSIFYNLYYIRTVYKIE